MRWVVTLHLLQVAVKCCKKGNCNEVSLCEHEGVPWGGWGWQSVSGLHVMICGLWGWQSFHLVLCMCGCGVEDQAVCCYLLNLSRCLHHPVFAIWSRGVYCVGMSTVSPVRPPSWLLTCHASSINLLFYFWRSCLVHGSHPSQMCGQTTGNDALWLIVSFFQEYINSAHWKSTPPFKILTFCWLVAWN